MNATIRYVRCRASSAFDLISLTCAGVLCLALCAQRAEAQADTPRECQRWQNANAQSNGVWATERPASIHALELLPHALGCCAKLAAQPSAADVDKVCSFALEGALACRAKQPDTGKRAYNPREDACGTSARVSDALTALEPLQRSARLQAAYARASASADVTAERAGSDWLRVKNRRCQEPPTPEQIKNDPRLIGAAAAGELPSTESYRACICQQVSDLSRYEAQLSSERRASLNGLVKEYGALKVRTGMMMRQDKVLNEPGVEAFFALDAFRGNVYKRLPASTAVSETNAPATATLEEAEKLSQTRAKEQREQAELSACLGAFEDAPVRAQALRRRADASEAEAERARQCQADEKCVAKHEVARKKAIVDELVVSICDTSNARTDAAGQVRAQRARGQRFGVVNLRDLNDSAENVETLEANLDEQKARYKELTGRPFAARLCKP